MWYRSTLAESLSISIATRGNLHTTGDLARRASSTAQLAPMSNASVAQRKARRVFVDMPSMLGDRLSARERSHGRRAIARQLAHSRDPRNGPPPRRHRRSDVEEQHASRGGREDRRVVVGARIAGQAEES